MPIPEVLEHISQGGTNETLMDWTQIQPAYIVVVKDTEKLSEDLLKQAEEYSQKSGLPIKIHDAYEIAKRKETSKTKDESKPIEGSYKASDLGIFAKMKSKMNVVQIIKDTLKSKTKNAEDIQK